MKNLTILLTLLALCLDSTQTFAQKKTKAEEVIIIELFVGQRKSAQKIEVPINKGVEKAKEKAIKPAWAKDGDSSLPPQYNFNLEAYFKDKNSSKIYFRAVVERCQEVVRKDFVVNRNQEIELELGCDIKLKAYYGLESKEKRTLFKLPMRRN